uniref:hypothetical protein n=1 Tax=Treponema sp. TaxID=166 RepID=UPI00298E2F00
MAYLIMGLAAIVIIVALSYFSNLLKKNNQTSSGGRVGVHNTNNAQAQSGQGANPGFVTCPVCNTRLEKGQNLISKVYRPM